MIDPGTAYFKAITDGDGEAIYLKGISDAARSQR